MSELRGTRRYLVVAASLFAVLSFVWPLLVPDVQVPKAQAQSAQSALWITPRGGKPLFVMAANYEGPADRAWQLWDDNKFDPALIERDFANAAAYGINTLRIFIQPSLRTDLLAGDFSKLDTITALARKYSLYLIITLTDWAEADLVKAGSLDAAIAAHLANEPSILAYDVKNEPQFTDIVGAIYPSSTLTVPLQAPDTIAVYGDRVARGDIATYRKSSEGRAIIPARMTDDQAYAIANYYKLYLEFLNAGSAWVNSHPSSTTLDYIDSHDAASWGPFLQAVDATLAQWVDIQAAPVRAADPGRPITVGYSNIIFAKMPSNEKLDFESVHRFTADGYSGLNATFLVLGNLQRTFADRPLMLEEFGYPGQVRNSSGGITGYDPRTTANLESAVWAYLYSNGFAGGGKWMLNNDVNGDDPAENTYGLFDNSGQPKLSASALRQLANVFAHSTPGSFSHVAADASYAVSYSYVSPDNSTIIAGGRVYTGTNITYQSNAPSQFVFSSSSRGVTLFSTDIATASLNLPSLYGIATADMGRAMLTVTDPKGQPWTPSQPTIGSDWLAVPISPLYTYKLSVVPRAVDPSPAQVDVKTVYFPQTAHNLSGDFLLYWQQHGGLAIFGYPLSDAFVENGYTVQYFERNRFELHPENQPPYNVLLGRLGADATKGLNFPTVDAFTSTKAHLYFPETQHSLNNAFLGYWQKHGGLAQFGYPLSEEMQEISATDGKTYTVQYFERARFEYHPENKGDGQVLLGLLGVSTMQGKGWVP